MTFSNIVTTCLENREMSGNFTAVGEIISVRYFSQNLGNIRRKSCQEKLTKYFLKTPSTGFLYLSFSI